MLYYCTVKVVLSVFTAIAILTELRATDSCFTTSHHGRTASDLSTSQNSQACDYDVLGSSGSGRCSRRGLDLGTTGRKTRYHVFCRVGISRGGGLRPSVSALMTFFEVAEEAARREIAHNILDIRRGRVGRGCGKFGCYAIRCQNVKLVQVTSQWHTGNYQLVARPVTVTRHCAELACSLRVPLKTFFLLADAQGGTHSSAAGECSLYLRSHLVTVKVAYAQNLIFSLVMRASDIHLRV